MKLQTKIPLIPEENQIDYNAKVLLMGSCFVESIGAKLEYYKFQTSVNPFGILFHPLVIQKLVFRALNDDLFTEEDIFFFNEQWHCFEVHSVLSNSSKDGLLQQLNDSLISLKDYLVKATHIILTYGTSWVYRYNETGKVVANCYKIPQQQFTKELLSVEDITVSIKKTTSLIKNINPEVTFINTVSPVRHLKDGFVENTRSKSHLITAIHHLINQQSPIRNLQSFYFPSYEIMMDELRDYRFYKEDMIHPNTTAISIIWEAFSKVWIADETQAFQKEINSIQKGLQHRPFSAESEEHQTFLKQLHFRIKTLQQKINHIKF
ncbi:MAG: GSCFA domain-containing protein [Flavobacteriaceae bacterium]|nr:GSCFA domain-containing protein [Flavobacteriaceae bacterium]